MKLKIAIAILITSTGLAWAQNPNTENGYIPGHSYVNGDIDSIDLANGGVSINIPLRTFKQQDPVSIDYSIQYGSKHLVLEAGDLPISGGGNLWLWGDRDVFSDENEREFSLQDEVAFSGASIVMNQDFRWSVPFGVSDLYINVPLHTPDGAVHKVGYDPTYQMHRTADPSGYLVGPPAQDYVPMYSLPSAATGAHMFTDTSGVVHTAWKANQIVSADGSAVPLYQYHGFTPSVIQFDATDHIPVSLRDTKGLVLPWTDPNNGHVGTLIQDTSHCAGFTNISTVFRLDMPGPAGSNAPYYLCYAQIHVNTNFPNYADNTLPYGLTSLTQADQNIQMLSVVTLPDGTSWTFTYDDRDAGDDPSINYGTLTRVTLPTGGVIDYTYGTNEACAYALGGGSYISRFLEKKVKTVSGSTAMWSYTYTPAIGEYRISDEYINGSATMVVTNPDQSKETHTFYDALDNCDWSDQKTVTQDAQGHLMSEVDTSWWEMNGLASDFDDSSAVVTYALLGPAEIKTILPDGSWFNHIYMYDAVTAGFPEPSYGNLVEECIYDFNTDNVVVDGSPCGSSGTTSPLMHTVTSYEYQTNANVRRDNLMKLPHQTSTFDATNTAVSQSKYSYDGGGTSSYYGNLSETDVWLNTNSVNPWIPTTYTYDSQGVMTSMTDALGRTTSYGKDSNAVYTQSVTPPSTNGINHTSHALYDPGTDLVTRVYAENGSNTSSQSINYTYDSMLRLTNVSLPTTTQGIGGAALTYTDGTNSSVTSNLMQSSASYVTTVQSYDGFGRLKRSRRGDISTDYFYDGMGRTVGVSNPYISSTDSTYGMTCTHYDALGRVKSVRRVAGSSCSFSAPSLSETNYQYNGQWTDVFDGDGHHSRQRKNALGQLTKVLEPDSSNHPVLETDYSYDILGNLLSVNQIGVSGTETARSRTFKYDSLSRLISSYNPETGTSSGTCPGVTGPWSLCYGYDLTGNLISRIDARGLKATMSYDALNRVSSKSYSYADGSADPNNTPSNCYSYDVSSLGASVKGRLSAEWTQHGSCATAPPVGALSSRTIASYDALGRVTSDNRCILLSCIASRPITYDLAGNLTQYFNQTIQVNNVFDTLNRLQKVSVTSPFGDVTPIYSVSSFGSGGPQAIDVGSVMTRIRTYDPLMRVSSETVVKP